MPFKTNLPTASCPALTGFSVLEVRGIDAPVFLQAQLMNDVVALVPGRWQWNGWLTPKGRLVALFSLLRLAPDRFLLVLPDFPAAELQARLQRFVFRSKVTLRAADDLAVAAGPPVAFAASDQALDEADDIVALDFGGEGGARTLRIVPATHPALAAPDAGADAAWFAADLMHGLPRLGPDAVEAWTPQMLSLGRLSAFSLKKGCYPGQEIVARTHYLGQAKRVLTRLSGTDLLPELPVDGPTGGAGTVVCATTDGREGLAVLPAEAHEGWATAGGPVRILPLQGGLARPG